MILESYLISTRKREVYTFTIYGMWYKFHNPPQTPTLEAHGLKSNWREQLFVSYKWSVFNILKTHITYKTRLWDIP